MNEQIKHPLLFVGGDISGIQDFIYNISSRKAAVSLKGRSAYLAEYLKKVCNGILTLSPVTQGEKQEEIYCSGGKFYLIVDDTNEIRLAIEEYANKVERELWDEQHGQLGIAIGFVPFAYTNDKEEQVYLPNNEEPQDLKVLWSTINEIFTERKKHKYRNLLVERYHSLFDVQEVGGNAKVCAITGIESPDCVPLDDDKDTILVLPSVKDQVLRGNKLRAKDDFKTFDEYANGTYLGVLRMDVDRLGERFQKGFHNLAEYKLLSNKLTDFFENQLVAMQKEDTYHEFLNIIYAGGDDLFVIGRWDKVIDFAAEIHNRFMQFLQGEDLTISGGIAIVDSKFPIAKAAEIAGEAEERAKKHNNGEKNALCLFDKSISWNVEFESVRKQKDEFIRQINDNDLPRGILHKLILYADMATKGDNLKYIWHSTYYLTRLAERCGEKSRAFVEDLRDHQLTKGVRVYQLAAIAARWAELELKYINQ